MDSLEISLDKLNLDSLILFCVLNADGVKVGAPRKVAA